MSTLPLLTALRILIILTFVNVMYLQSGHVSNNNSQSDVILFNINKITITIKGVPFCGKANSGLGRHVSRNLAQLENWILHCCTHDEKEIKFRARAELQIMAQRHPRRRWPSSKMPQKSLAMSSQQRLIEQRGISMMAERIMVAPK